MKNKKKKTRNAIQILDREFVRGNKKRKEAIRHEVEKSQISTMIYDIRKRAGLSQKQLAARVGTTQSVISRLEDADYEGHSLDMLTRIATVLHYKVQLQIMPEPRYAHVS